jgi:hypothetical protein
MRGLRPAPPSVSEFFRNLLDDLRNRRLKIAQLDDLNDPFELKSVNLCNPLHAQAFDGTDKREGYKAEMARRYGVLCLSEDKTDVFRPPNCKQQPEQ